MNPLPNSIFQLKPDVIIIGGGIFGLWAARHAIKRGERVLVLEKRTIGAGASGGFLGSLMPHMPDNWNAKKQMQFEALTTIDEAIRDLESDTGVSCGYRRCGRVMPMTHEKMVPQVKLRLEGAVANWQHPTKTFTLEYLAPDFKGTIAEDWLNEDCAPFGATFDTLAARVNPKAYILALANFVQSKSHGLGQIVEGVEVERVLGGKNDAVVHTMKGEMLGAASVIIANGWEAYDLLGKTGAQVNGQAVTGRGVKGQAVLLDFHHLDDRPILYDNGVYVVPHANNRIAVGSTSVNNWMPHGLGENPDWPTESFAGEIEAGDPLAQKLVEADINSFDQSDMSFYEKAVELCPVLKAAEIIAHWANVRPRNTVRNLKTGKIGTEPIFGPLDDCSNIQLAVGGFKISLGLAHVERFA